MNSFLARREAVETAIFNAGLRIGFQQALDFFQIALHDKEIMGKNAMGEDKLWRVLQGVLALEKQYKDAFQPKMAEADYLQELLDRQLAEICKKRQLVPFAERYDELKECTYGRNKNGLRKRV